MANPPLPANAIDLARHYWCLANAAAVGDFAARFTSDAAALATIQAWNVFAKPTGLALVLTGDRDTPVGLVNGDGVLILPEPS